MAMAMGMAMVMAIKDIPWPRMGFPDKAMCMYYVLL
jgi:hypothetical protein